jgi:hypothetical protein
MNMKRQLYNVPAPHEPGRYPESFTSHPNEPYPAQMTIDTENPVNSKSAQAVLGLSETYITALKKAMGIKGRYFFLSDVRKWMRSHPDFRIRDVQHHWKTKPQGNRRGSVTVAISQ